MNRARTVMFSGIMLSAELCAQLAMLAAGESLLAAGSFIGANFCNGNPAVNDEAFP